GERAGGAVFLDQAFPELLGAQALLAFARAEKTGGLDTGDHGVALAQQLDPEHRAVFAVAVDEEARRVLRHVQHAAEERHALYRGGLQRRRRFRNAHVFPLQMSAMSRQRRSPPAHRSLGDPRRHAFVRKDESPYPPPRTDCNKNNGLRAVFTCRRQRWQNRRPCRITVRLYSIRACLPPLPSTLSARLRRPAPRWTWIPSPASGAAWAGHGRTLSPPASRRWTRPCSVAGRWER